MPINCCVWNVENATKIEHLTPAAKLLNGGDFILLTEVLRDPSDWIKYALKQYSSSAHFIWCPSGPSGGGFRNENYLMIWNEKLKAKPVALTISGYEQYPSLKEIKCIDGKLSKIEHSKNCRYPIGISIENGPVILGFHEVGPNDAKECVGMGTMALNWVKSRKAIIAGDFNKKPGKEDKGYLSPGPTTIGGSTFDWVFVGEGCKASIVKSSKDYGNSDHLMLKFQVEL